MIEVMNLTKQYGSRRAVDDASFTAPAGVVTGFLGPNGAGKTTTLRILLGLARADSGQALIDGVPYGKLTSPLHTVGAVLDSMGFHPGRTGRNHLRIVARAVGISRRRVDEVLEFVTLTDAADRATSGYSQGMRQRLALAGALLGDPSVLVLDEPANGLDPAGMSWLRQLLGGWASQGRTVLFSSHTLSEVEKIADRVVIINQGRTVLEEESARTSTPHRAVVVRTTDCARLDEVADSMGWQVHRNGSGQLVIHGASPDEIGLTAAREGIVLSELSWKPTGRRLEERFLELTNADKDVDA